jgi:hypothetical protein
MGTGSFPGVKRPGRGVDHPPPSSAEVEERGELDLYSPSGPSWPVLGRTLPVYTYVYIYIYIYTSIYKIYKFGQGLNTPALKKRISKTGSVSIIRITTKGKGTVPLRTPRRHVYGVGV